MVLQRVAAYTSHPDELQMCVRVWVWVWVLCIMYVCVLTLPAEKWCCSVWLPTPPTLTSCRCV
jgi:hypothetical protein